MPAIARVGDPVGYGDNLAQGSGDVFANGLPVTRENVDQTAGHGCWPPTVVITASSTVFVNNIPVTRVGDTIQVHCCGPACHSAPISNGSPDVFVDS